MSFHNKIPPTFRIRYYFKGYPRRVFWHNAKAFMFSRRLAGRILRIGRAARPVIPIHIQRTVIRIRATGTAIRAIIRIAAKDRHVYNIKAHII